MYLQLSLESVMLLCLQTFARISNTYDQTLQDDKMLCTQQNPNNYTHIPLLVSICNLSFIRTYEKGKLC